MKLKLASQEEFEKLKLASQEEVGGLDSLSEWQNLMRQKIDFTVMLRELEPKEELIEANIQKFRTKHPELISREIELMQLQRKAWQYEKTFGFLMKSHADIQMLRQMQTSELSIITEAFPSSTPIKPKKKMTLILGAVLGVMLGMGGAFFLEYMDNSFRKKEDIERWLGLPMIGAIPQIPLAKNKKKTTPTSTNINRWTELLLYQLSLIGATSMEGENSVFDAKKKFSHASKNINLNLSRNLNDDTSFSVSDTRFLNR